MDQSITANELKTKGIAAIEKATANEHEAVITVRGKSRYVVMPIAEYNHLRECELETALHESKEDVKAGRYLKETVQEHMKRITDA